ALVGVLGAAALATSPLPGTASPASAAGCSSRVPGPPGNDLARQIFVDAPGRRGPITVLGDSVLMGSGSHGVSLPAMLAEQGWGPIRFRSGLGYNTGLGG